ncbi:HIT family protein [Chitinispirillales bacterium ANBcel5]|uniref:HIT family protein n=1 Tax=Cellulosispirillum alkaliphilum TaxID=3039283 RepID=UPI002A583C4E|nr:HIT family protein [Chitinispirillales bacterium ANBcel5]
MTASPQRCKFCSIISQKTHSYTVMQNDYSLAFLDNRPLFWGHVLLIPRQHITGIEELIHPWAPDFLMRIKTLSVAVEKAMGAEGTFIAINNKVSQSVPHLHVHIVPRKKGDGLKGFFWPRHPYRDEAQIKEVAERIHTTLEELNGNFG